MTLLINEAETEDDEIVRTKMDGKTTGKNLFPNKVTIKVEGRGSSTMTMKDRNKLAQECKKADFRVLHEDKETKTKSRIIPPYPCAHELPKQDLPWYTCLGTEWQ